MVNHKVIDFASATFSDSLMGLLAKNFAIIEARSTGTLEAVKQAIVTISEDIDVIVCRRWGLAWVHPEI